MQRRNIFSRKKFAFFLLATVMAFFIAPPPASAVEMLRNLVPELAKGRSPSEAPYRFRCPVFGRCNHRIVGMFMVTRRKIREAWVVAAVPNEESCHSCTSRITLEVYRKRNGGWQKYRVWRDFDEAGNWGLVQPETVRMGRIDDRRMVFFLEGGFTNMGTTTESVDVYVIDDEDITPAGRYCLTYDNEGAITPENNIRLRKWSARYELGSMKGRPALIFHVKDGTGDNDTTVAFEFMGKGLRLFRDSLPDSRLHVPCGECAE